MPFILRTVAGLEAASFVLFVFSNWQENRIFENHPAVDMAEWKFWGQFGYYAFAALSVFWLFGVIYSTQHYFILRWKNVLDDTQSALRTCIGFGFFPLFIAVIAYIPLYVLIDLLNRMMEAVFT